MQVCMYIPQASSKLRLCIAGQRTGVFIHHDIAALLTVAKEDDFNSEIIPKYDKYKIDVQRNGLRTCSDERMDWARSKAHIGDRYSYLPEHSARDV
jgi:hypothetical protein